MAFFLDEGVFFAAAEEADSSGWNFRLREVRAAFERRFFGGHAECNGLGQEPMVIQKGWLDRTGALDVLLLAGQAKSRSPKGLRRMGGPSASDRQRVALQVLCGTLRRENAY